MPGHSFLHNGGLCGRRVPPAQRIPEISDPWLRSLPGVFRPAGREDAFRFGKAERVERTVEGSPEIQAVVTGMTASHENWIVRGYARPRIATAAPDHGERERASQGIQAGPQRGACSCGSRGWLRWP